MNSNNWTQYQYTMFRFLLGAFVAVHFLYLIPWAAEVFSNEGMVSTASASPLFGWIPSPLQWSDSPEMVMALVVIGAICGAALAMGQLERVTAILAALVFGWLFQRNPLIANPSLPVVGWMLIAHAVIVSLGGGRKAPLGSWRLDQGVWIAAWIVLAVAYSYSGFTKILSPSWVSGDAIRLVLENPLARDHLLREFMLSTPPVVLKLLTWSVLLVELLFVPLCLIRKLRPGVWLFMLVGQFGFLTFLNFADLTIPMFLIHLLTFDPKWLTEGSAPKSKIIFYDGNCALCHTVVKQSLSEDCNQIFQYAPLQGQSASLQLPVSALQEPFDSFVIRNGDGQLLTKGNALIELLKTWGGLWMIGAILLKLLPGKAVNWMYGQVGNRRYKWFGSSEAFCPLVPGKMREAFLP